MTVSFGLFVSGSVGSIVAWVDASTDCLLWSSTLPHSLVGTCGLLWESPHLDVRGSLVPVLSSRFFRHITFRHSCNRCELSLLQSLRLSVSFVLWYCRLSQCFRQFACFVLPLLQPCHAKSGLNRDIGCRSSGFCLGLPILLLSRDVPHSWYVVV
jgi:hypothetical protein